MRASGREAIKKEWFKSRRRAHRSEVGQKGTRRALQPATNLLQRVLQRAGRGYQLRHDLLSRECAQRGRVLTHRQAELGYVTPHNLQRRAHRRGHRGAVKRAGAGGQRCDRA